MNTLTYIDMCIGIHVLYIGILHFKRSVVAVAAFDLGTQACRPEVYGEVPMTRFRHTGVVVAPQLSSTIQQSVNQLLHPAKRDASQGSVILLFGGYNTMGQEFGGDKFEVGLEILTLNGISAVSHVQIGVFSCQNGNNELWFAMLPLLCLS